MKFEEIIKRLEALEEANNELRKENAELRNKKKLMLYFHNIQVREV